ncbi:hypothetical protein HOLleu_37998 [Holothuria leucospilota]|uniref:Uncharacterized protein n=1 Tax=Holothuria leucospilota TaxID=206669 RepID=A0A9Q0YKB3_HOLLE|nr:hypothetical protein HOLleu_37998 [Holothuria leucospilota]
MIFDFIWQGNPDKVKRSVLINDIQKGGLKAIHIKSFINSLNCTWVRRYCDNSKGLWKIFFDLELTKYGKDFLFYCNCSSQDVRIKNVFVRQVVHAWCDATFCIPISPEDVKRQLIWNNSSVKINKKVVFDRYLHEKGIVYVQDCFDENGSPFTYERFTTNYDISNFPFYTLLGTN